MPVHASKLRVIAAPEGVQFLPPSSQQPEKDSEFPSALLAERRKGTPNHAIYSGK